MVLRENDRVSTSHSQSLRAGVDTMLIYDKKPKLFLIITVIYEIELSKKYTNLAYLVHYMSSKIQFHSFWCFFFQYLWRAFFLLAQIFSKKKILFLELMGGSTEQNVSLEILIHRNFPNEMILMRSAAPAERAPVNRLVGSSGNLHELGDAYCSIWGSPNAILLLATGYLKHTGQVPLKRQLGKLLRNNLNSNLNIIWKK